MKTAISFRPRSTSRARRAPGFRGRKASAGFTLREIVIVVTLIGLILGVVASRIMGSQAAAEYKLASAHVTDIAGKVDQYQADTGVLPSSLDQLVTSPSGVSGWLGPYATAEQIKDPWHNPITIRAPGENGAPFQVVSLGKDGKPGGESVNADIVKP
ncbi:MAG: type II secretion system protein GspG [Arenimonas sp.]